MPPVTAEQPYAPGEEPDVNPNHIVAPRDPQTGKPIRSSYNHYPMINTSGGSTNCPWVVLAALIAQEPAIASPTRTSTQYLFNKLENKGIFVDNKEALEDDNVLLAKARGLGDIEDVFPLCSIDELPGVEGLPQKKSFGAGIRIGHSFGHWVVGYVDRTYVRLTDYQTHDNGEYFNDTMRSKGGIIEHVFWFT